MFTSKQGWFGVLLILFKVLWQALTVWQTLDFLPGRLMPLADFLGGLGGTLLLVGLGLLFMYRAVSARWPESHTETTSEPETQKRMEESPAYPGRARNKAFLEAWQAAKEIEEEPGDEALRRRCRELADELRQFLEDNENLDEEQTMRLYNRRLGDKAGALLEELEEHGLYPPENLKGYRLAANAKPLSPFAIRNLASTLGTIEHKRSYETSVPASRIAAHRENQPSDEELKRRCIELAEELTKFLDRWEDYKHQPKIFPEEPWEWPRYTMERYRETLEPRLMKLLDDLEQREWLTAEARAHLVPTDDPQKIREVAARLSSIGHRD